jgi:hypothetical protein
MLIKTRVKILTVLIVAGLAVMVSGQVQVEPLPFCTPGVERMPWLHGNTLYFVGPAYDIYQVTFEVVEGKWVWGTPEPVPGEINTEANEVNPCVIEHDGKLIMYFARHTTERDFDFFRAEFDPEKGLWTNVQVIPELSTDTQDWDIWVNPEETVAYITTKGGFGGVAPVGGRDVWMSKKVNGVWSTPINLKEVNTIGNEWSVFVDPAGRIWLDGARDDAIGGYDIYVYDPSTGTIEHPGQYLNSFWDERSVWTDGKTIIFTSPERKGGAGGYDLYIANLTDSDFEGGAKK